MNCRMIFLGDYCNADATHVRLMPDLKKLLSSAQLISINFEGPVIRDTFRAALKAGPVIGQPESAATMCKQWGVTHFALANNHIMDYGSDGLNSTLDQLHDCTTFGAGFSFDQAYRPCYVEIGGKRVALLTFSEAQFGVLQDENEPRAGYAWVDHPAARQAILKARSASDYVIVQVHAGLEMVGLPLPEWRLRFRELVDLGADLVIGHHPHVVQGSECYQGKMIHYSIGNFYMDYMLKQNECGTGAALLVTITEAGLGSELIPLTASINEVDIDSSGSTLSAYQGLCGMLSNGPEYYKEIQSICEYFWQNVYSDYYKSAVFGLGTRPDIKSAYGLARRLAGRLRYGKKISSDSELLLIHNICIETHRWAVERALKKCIASDP